MISMSSMYIIILSPMDLSVATSGLVILVKTQVADALSLIEEILDYRWVGLMWLTQQVYCVTLYTIDHPWVFRNDLPIGCN